MMSELSEFRWWIITAVIGIAMATMADLILPKIFANVIEYIETTPGSDFRSAIMAYGGQMMIVIVVTMLGAVFGNFGASRVSAGFSKKMRHEIFAKVHTFSQGELSEFGTASLITRNTNDVQQIQQFIGMFIRIFVRAPIIMIGGIIMTYTTNSRMAFPLLISIPGIVLIVYLISKFIIPMFQTIQDKVDSVNRVLREQISGVRVIRAFGTEAHEEDRFDETSKDYKKLSLKMMRISSLMNPLLSIILNMTVVTILFLASKDIQAGTFTQPGDLVAVVQYVIQILFSFIMVSMIFVMYPRAEASARRINEIMDKKPSIVDLKTTIQPAEGIRGDVEFRNVSFTFQDAQSPTLESLNFKVKKGQTTAIIGSTGSGKTTLLQLILRFFDVTQGAILIDGVDIREMEQLDLRSRIGYVPQRWQLFSGDIAENIRFGKDSATLPEMEEAAKTAQALDFISEKEDQFGARVAQGGTNFSGGQKQRLSIARAVVRKPEIYLFDDSFSALDAKTDANLRMSLANDAEGATQIIVAQRVSSIAQADEIIVMDAGRIVGKGTHKELLESCLIYGEIARSQFSEEEVAG